MIFIDNLFDRLNLAMRFLSFGILILWLTYLDIKGTYWIIIFFTFLMGESIVNDLLKLDKNRKYQAVVLLAYIFLFIIALFKTDYDLNQGNFLYFGMLPTLLFCGIITFCKFGLFFIRRKSK